MSGMGIYGLSGSGIDVDSMVRMGMMTKQNEYDRMYKKEVRNEWEKEGIIMLLSLKLKSLDEIYCNDIDWKLE